MAPPPNRDQTESSKRSQNQVFPQTASHVIPGDRKSRKSRNRAGISVPPLLVADKSRLFAFDVSEVDFIPLAITMAYFAQA
jgi:hypothetical protein